MMKIARISRIIVLTLMLAVACVGQSAYASRLNDKVLNRPYADMRRWHLGFSIGGYVSDMMFTHNGLVTEDGMEWRVDQPDYQPGFCVNGLLDLRLNNYLSVRFTPGMYFGARSFEIRDLRSDAVEHQNLKSTFVVLPVDLKFAGMRYRNSRPYVTGGVMPTFDVAKKRSETLKFNVADCYLSVGFGCDFYLPYFKFIPEIKFCFGLTDLLVKDRPDLVEEPNRFSVTQSLSKATSRMIVFTLYFE